MRIPRSPPATDLEQLVRGLPSGRLQEIVKAAASPEVRTASGGHYLHWDDLRHRTPPAELAPEEWWALLVLQRAPSMRWLPLTDPRSRPYRFTLPDEAQELIHLVDSNLIGHIAISEQVTDANTRDRYIVRSLMEEAITSSQLEGSATTHRVGKELLRSGRKPRDDGERMILNNYLAMQRIRGMVDRPLDRAAILELHERVTRGTLDVPDGGGRLRRPDEDIKVWDESDGRVLYQPPDASSLPDRIDAMCRFANGDEPAFYLNPVVRAILVHLWLACDHPFVDGNGRTARALFYWTMLRNEYWLCEFISISAIVRKAPSRYARSFLHCQTDGNDATYFLLEQLRVLRLAIRELHDYIEGKMRETRETEALLRRSAGFNHRQIALLGHAIRHPDAEYTFRSHRTSHDVVYETARSDLLKLVRRRLLRSRKVGNRYVFTPAPDLARRVARKSS